MAFELTSDETARLEASIKAALRAFKAGSVSEAQTVEFVRRLVASAALDNRAALEDWMFAERMKQWLQDSAGA